MADNSIGILFDLRVQENRVKRELERANKVMQEADRRTKKYKNSVKDVINAELKLANIRKQRIKVNKELSNSQKQLNSSISANTKATGGATSAALELGRVVSDAPYGIRGMANNISQLASNVFFMSRKVDEATGKVVGFGGAMKQLAGGLMGGAGLLLAFQMLIAIFEAQNQVKEKAIDVEKRLREEISKTLSATRDIIWLNQKRIDRSVEIIKLEEDIKDAQKAGNQAEVNKLLKEKIALQLKDAQVKLITLKGVLEDTKGTERNIEAQKALFKVKEEIYRLEREQSRLGIKKDESIKTSTVTVADLDLSSFDIKSKDLLSKTNSLNQQIEMSLAESEQEKLEIQLKYQQASVLASKKAEIQKINDARALYEKKVNDEFSKEEAKNKKLLESKKISQSQFDDWQIKASQEVIDKLDEADIKQAESIEGVIKKYDALFELYEKLYGVRLKAIGADSGGSKSKELGQIASWLNAYKDLVGGVTDFINGEYERQLTIEQNKTNALNEELNNRLLNESLSKDERAKIQNEIWQNDENLRKKQNEIKKKQFNANKAFNMSTAVIDTYFAAQRAYASQMTLTPDAPIRAKIAAAVATAAGLARVSSIARQKFQPESASTPIRTASAGGGGGGVGDRSFNFNLVGASQQNQLAQAIQGTFDKPIKAYVVSKDITNQQQLDANTKSTARFGG